MIHYDFVYIIIIKSNIAMLVFFFFAFYSFVYIERLKVIFFFTLLYLSNSNWYYIIRIINKLKFYLQISNNGF